MNARESMQKKLHPARFSHMSVRMGAIVGYLIDVSVTDPDITGLTITSDNFVLAATSDDPFMNSFIGSWSDLKRNLKELIEVADLTKEEKGVFFLELAEKLRDWRVN